MDKLISMTDFVLLNSEIHHSIQSESEFYNVVSNYANFLKQPLTLGMFVPCDLDGNVLEEPKGVKCCGGIQNDCDCRGELQYDEELFKEYQESKERVLFECFKWINSKCISNDDIDIYFDSDGIKAYNGFKKTDLCSIEKLIELNLKLTPTAQKQLS